MNTIETVLRQVTNVKSIMQALKDALREVDPAFPEMEGKFLQASENLEHELGDKIIPSAGEYLEAKEEEFAMELIYIGWQGFQFNLDIFQNPVNALLLRGDFEDLHRERRLGTLTTTGKARDVQAAFNSALQALPVETRNLTDGVTEFYSYLETVGYKIAHYFAFRLADGFLPFVIPGYTSDPVNTLQYSGELKRWLQIDLDRLE